MKLAAVEPAPVIAYGHGAGPSKLPNLLGGILFRSVWSVFSFRPPVWVIAASHAPVGSRADILVCRFGRHSGHPSGHRIGMSGELADRKACPTVRVPAAPPMSEVAICHNPDRAAARPPGSSHCPPINLTCQPEARQHVVHNLPHDSAREGRSPLRPRAGQARPLQRPKSSVQTMLAVKRREAINPFSRRRPVGKSTRRIPEPQTRFAATN